MTGLASNWPQGPPLAVLAHYPPDCAPRAWTNAASGFSGAEVYRLETARGTLALRRWPAEHPSPERLSWIHSVLTQAEANGFDRLPLPIRTVGGFETESAPLLRRSSAGSLRGDTFVSHDGHLWELAPWLPGEADFLRNPSPARLTAAMQALAQLHLALANVQPNPKPQGPSPGLTARLAQLRAEKVSGTISRAIRARRASIVEMVPDTVSSAGTVSSVTPRASASGATAGLPSSASSSGPVEPIDFASPATDNTSPTRSEAELTSSRHPARQPRSDQQNSANESAQHRDIADSSPTHQEPPRTLAALRASVTTQASLRSTLLDAAHEILAHFERLAPDLERQLAANVERPVALQPALRDIHDEHVLFLGDQVTGIIDFGAMRFETVAGDIARLLGSLVASDPAGWQAGLSAYEAVRPLSGTERELVPLFDRSGLLLGGMNWLEWLFVAGRQFADLPRVRARLDAILSRLRA